MIQRLIDANDIARWYSETHPVSIARANEMLVLDEIIKFMPSADAEPVQSGHWEDVGRVYGHEDLFCGVCSECGKITVAFETMPERCSHCGAKMYEEDSKNV